MPLSIDRIMESSLYVDDLAAAKEFYSQALGLELLGEERGRHLFYRCGASMVLLFKPERTLIRDGAVPAHGSHGPGHLAFAMDVADVAGWRDHLVSEGVEIESEIAWPHGGHSLYFRDPSGNSIELVTPQVWGL